VSSEEAGGEATTTRSEMSTHRELDAILSLADLDRQKVALQALTVRARPQTYPRTAS
jgi:hypothetical protein